MKDLGNYLLVQYRRGGTKFWTNDNFCTSIVLLYWVSGKSLEWVDVKLVDLPSKFCGMHKSAKTVLTKEAFIEIEERR